MVSEAEKRRVGALIRHRRQVLDLDQPALARLVGVSRQTVSKWETGQSYPGRNAGKVEAALAPFSLATNGDSPQPPTDPRERQLYDALMRGVDDMTPAEALAIIGEERRRTRRQSA